MSDPTALTADLLAEARKIEQLVSSLSESDLNRRETPNDWSVRQIIHHIADVEVGDAMRLRQMLAHDAPLIVAYDEGLFAERLHYDRPIAASLATFSALRASNAAILERIPGADWSRQGRHEEHALYTVEILVHRSIEHDRLHLQQMQRALNSPT